MHILLTRPIEDCSEMILKFKSLGHQVSHLPLLTIGKMDYEEIKFSDYGGIIFTSANAIKFLDLNKLDKKILCFCVGVITEKKSENFRISKYNFCRGKCFKFKGINFTEL